jgi:cell division septal protein FtsQ
LRSTNKKRVKINGKKNGRQSAQKGGRLPLILKGGTIIFFTVIFIIIIAFGVDLSAHNLTVSDIEVSGNYHLSKDDVIRSLNINRGANLLTLELNVVEARLKSNPWIKDVSLRKQMPDTLMIRIKEAEPKALLYQNNSTYLVEEEGNMLEQVMSEGTAFLPVIRSDNTENNKKGIQEAIQLIEALNKKGILARKESVEIRLNSYGPDMVVDGSIIKVGYGDYMDKLARWEELEPEVTKLGQTSYIDLRFRDRVIVKPLQPAEDEEAKAAKASAAVQTGKPAEFVKAAKLDSASAAVKPEDDAKTVKQAEPPKASGEIKPAKTAKKTKSVKKSKKTRRSRKAKT